MNIVNVGYGSTNYYVVSSGRKRLLVDIGWPGTLPQLLANLRRADIPLGEIGHLLATHYHPDHAGAAQELAEMGVRLLVMETQREAIPLLGGWMKPEHRYKAIDARGAIILSATESRRFLGGLGIAGAIVATPGHSDDSVTLVLDDGDAFTGDLPGPSYADAAKQVMVRKSWRSIASLGARTIRRGHGPARDIDSIVGEIP